MVGGEAASAILYRRDPTFSKRKRKCKTKKYSTCKRVNWMEKCLFLDGGKVTVHTVYKTCLCQPFRAQNAAEQIHA